MADNSRKEKSKMPFSTQFVIFTLLVTAVVFLPLTIVVSASMIPTLMAVIVDNHQRKTAWFAVGAMNLAGTVPSCFNLWDAGNTVAAAFNLLSQPMTIIISFGGALAGWFIYHNVPFFVAAIILRKNEGRLGDIDKRQKELIKKWGKEVETG